MRTPYRKSHGKITFPLYCKPFSCGGNCIYCFSQKGFTKSTTSNEDTLLSKETSWNGGKQLEKRYQLYSLNKDSGIKCDLALKGDSIGLYDEEYLRQYTKEMYDFLNNCPSKNLKEAMFLQNIAKDKCVTYKVETRPDQIDEKKCLLFVELGITTVEIGVQTLDDNVLCYINRGHDSALVKKVTQLLRKFGFEVCYHMMVGLPGSSIAIDKKVFTETLWQNEFSPDALKIYPCLLLKEQYVKQNKLRTLFYNGVWKPLSTSDFIAFMNECYSQIPSYVHINRIQRIISEEKIEAGPSEDINRKLFSDISNCLWQRSVANKLDNWNRNFENYKIIVYSQGNNRFCFEAIYEKNIVLGYSRLDIISEKSAIIRDIRVLGDMKPVNYKNEEKIGCQHIGIGSSLLKSMEKMANSSNLKFIYVKPSFGTINWFLNRQYVYVNDYYLSKTLIERDKEQAKDEFFKLISFEGNN